MGAGQCLIQTSHCIVTVFLPMPRKHRGARGEGGARRRLGSGETGAGAMCLWGRGTRGGARQGHGRRTGGWGTILRGGGRDCRRGRRDCRGGGRLSRGRRDCRWGERRDCRGRARRAGCGVPHGRTVHHWRPMNVYNTYLCSSRDLY
jgi:hypothetical protein